MRDQLRRRQRRMASGVVVEQHVAGRCDVASEHIPRRDGSTVGGIEARFDRQPTRGDHDHVGFARLRCSGHRRTCRSGRRRRAARVRHRATRSCRAGRVGAGCEQRDGPAHPSTASPPTAPPSGPARRPPVPLRAHPARHRRRRPAERRGRLDVVGHRSLAARCGVVDAQRLSRLVDPIETVGRADARTDLGLAIARSACARCAGRRCGPGSCRPCRACPPRSRGGPSRRRRSWRRASPGGRCARGRVPAKSRCGAEGIPWIGITSVNSTSVAMYPRITLTKSMRPSVSSTSEHLEPDAGVDPTGLRLVDRDPRPDDEVRSDAFADRTKHRQRKVGGGSPANRRTRRGECW